MESKKEEQKTQEESKLSKEVKYNFNNFFHISTQSYLIGTKKEKQRRKKESQRRKSQKSPRKKSSNGKRKG